MRAALTFLLTWLAAGCSILVPGPGELTVAGEDAGFDAQAPARDGGDGGDRDAGTDAGVDADTMVDAGSCTEVCEAPTPYCDPAEDRCVQCREDSHCDDGDGCTVDRCSLGTCSNNLEPFCVRQVVVGAEHACARLASGQIVCWGSNQYGQIGNGSTSDASTPRAVSPGITDAVEVAAGWFHTCARLLDGSVRCWGYNADGGLGDGTNTDRRRPVAVTGLDDAVGISTGASHTCALRAGGAVTCWGNNTNGELGDGTTTSSTAPVGTSGITSAVGIAAGGLITVSVVGHTCVHTTPSSVSCWGNNLLGQLGDGTMTDRSTPVTVVGLADVASIAAGGVHSCARLVSGVVRCWGANAEGQLGNGETTAASEPVPVVGLADAAEVGAGGAFTCARRPAGAIVCWGLNRNGQLGDGSTANSPLPIAVSGIDTATQLAVGPGSACALTADGSVRCWGSNSRGQLGDGTTTDSSVPVVVLDL